MIPVTFNLFFWLIALNAGVILALLLRGLIVHRIKRKTARMRIILDKVMNGKSIEPRDQRFIRGNKILYLDEVVRMRQSLEPGEREQININRWLFELGLDQRFVRRLFKGTVYQKCRSAMYLGYLYSDKARRALLFGFEKEKSETVRVYMAHSLLIHYESTAIPILIDSLCNSSLKYQHRICSVLGGFKNTFLEYFPLLKNRNEKEIRNLLIFYAGQFPSSALLSYLMDCVNDKRHDVEIQREAFRTIVKHYSGLMDFSPFIAHEDKLIRNLAIEGLGNASSEENLLKLISLLESDEVRKSAIIAVSNMIASNPKVFSKLNRILANSRNPLQRSWIISVLSRRIEFYLPRLAEDYTGAYTEIVREVIKSAQVSGLIEFLNRNKDRDIEQRIANILNECVSTFDLDLDEYVRYLKPAVLIRLGIEKEIRNPDAVSAKKESVPVGRLYLWLLFLIALPCTIFILIFGLPAGFSVDVLKKFLEFYLLYYGFYALSLNIINLLIMMLSFVGSRKQAKYQKIKTKRFLFHQGILPSISIVAPAYGEESTVIESVNSLLNLNYPDYEVIVVNDGSKDQTLQVLIDHFKLQKKDVFIPDQLKTRTVRGVYVNPQIPELMVLDKVNGGKADSLNAGINIARKEYFAGIDSDSLLESDSLLNLAGAFVDEEKLVLAAGGNIFPVNGSTVSLGDLVKVRAPRKFLPLVQTIEYIRAFMNGRVGWSYIKSLLIISGAFGIFHRQSVVDIHGYLTSKEMYDKDTVGEDMELVVRLSRQAREQKMQYAVQYCYNANCWTEVPEQLGIFRKQRDRWQRGLIDILSYHGKILANPKYGTMGLLGFPYYLIYEMLGPWIETSGLLVLFTCAALSWLSLPLLAFVILSSVVLGIFVSLFALLISQWDKKIFPVFDQIKLMIVSVVEAFGFRQWVGAYRVIGYINTLRKKTGWGKMTRRGFAKTGGPK